MAHQDAEFSPICGEITAEPSQAAAAAASDVELDHKLAPKTSTMLIERKVAKSDSRSTPLFGAAAIFIRENIILAAADGTIASDQRPAAGALTRDSENLSKPDGQPPAHTNLLHLTPLVLEPIIELVEAVDQSVNLFLDRESVFSNYRHLCLPYKGQ